MKTERPMVLTSSLRLLRRKLLAMTECEITWYCRHSCRQVQVLIIPVIMALIFLFQCTTAIAADIAKVATVGAIQGTAKMSTDKGKTWKPVGILTELSDGDQLLLKNKSKVKVIFYKPPHRETLAGPGKVRISSKNCVLLKGKPDLVKVSPSYKGIKALNSIKSSSENFAGVVIRNQPDVVDLLSPRGKIAGSKPRFEWEPVNKAQKYHFTIEDLDGKVLWNHTSSDTKIQYPDSAPPLEPGETYTWKVLAAKADGSAAKGNAAFQLVSGEILDNLKLLKDQAKKEIETNPEDPEPYVVLLTYCLQNKLLDESIDACEELLKIRPGDEMIKELVKGLGEKKGMKAGK